MRKLNLKPEMKEEVTAGDAEETPKEKKPRGRPRGPDYKEIGQQIGWDLLEANRLVRDTRQDSAQGGKPYLADDFNGLWPLNPDHPSTRLIMNTYGFNRAEKNYAVVVEEITMVALRLGTQVPLAYWQTSKDGALYVSCGPHAMVKAVDGVLEKLPNGTDDVWFASDMTYPEWEVTEPVNPLSLTIFNPAIETPDDSPTYTKQVQQDLVMVWFAALLANIRPLPLLLGMGPRGGGKTFMMKGIQRALRGEAGDVTGMPQTKGDFVALAVNNPLVVFDNIDEEVPSWFRDMIAHVVTGGKNSERLLYLNMQQTSRPFTASLAITSRTGKFLRPDIAERTLLVNVGEFRSGERKSESGMLREVDENRDGLMTWATVAASMLLERKDRAPVLNLRFVDFASLVWAYYNAVEEKPGMAEAALDALRGTQETVLMETDELVDAICSNIGNLVEKDTLTWHGDANDLLEKLQRLQVKLPYYGGSRPFARHLRESKGSLKHFGISLTWERQAGQRYFFGLEYKPE